MDDPVQGEQPQGADSQPGVFDSYLQSVPEDHREPVAQYLKDAERQVNSRLQEAAELRKTWQPYQDAGVTQLPPDQAQQLLEWYGYIQQEGNYEQWLREQYEQLDQQQVREDPSLEGLSRTEVEQLAQQMAEQQLAPFQQQLEQMQFQQATDQEHSLMQSALTDLEKEHGVKLNEEQKAVVFDLGMSAMPDEGQTLANGHNWVKAGFDRFQEIASQAQRAFVDQKAQQPPTPLQSGGVAGVQAPTDWKGAAEMARERMRQSNR